MLCSYHFYDLKIIFTNEILYKNERGGKPWLFYTISSVFLSNNGFLLSQRDSRRQNHGKEDPWANLPPQPRRLIPKVHLFNQLSILSAEGTGQCRHTQLIKVLRARDCKLVPRRDMFINPLNPCQGSRNITAEGAERT